MNKNIEILGVKIDNDSVEEAVGKVAGFLETDSLSTVGMIFANVLVEAVKEPGWTDEMGKMDLNIIGDKEVWKVCGDDLKQSLEEVEGNSFLKGICSYAMEHDKTVALLTEKDSERLIFQKHMKKQHRGLNIVGTFSLDDATEDEDSIVNLLNASAEDIIIAAIPSPYEEEFLMGCRQKLGARVWIGLGQTATSLMNVESKANFLGKLIEKRIFKRKVSKYQSEKGE